MRSQKQSRRLQQQQSSRSEQQQPRRLPVKRHGESKAAQHPAARLLFVSAVVDCRDMLQPSAELYSVAA